MEVGLPGLQNLESIHKIKWGIIVRKSTSLRLMIVTKESSSLGKTPGICFYIAIPPWTFNVDPGPCNNQILFKQGSVQI